MNEMSLSMVFAVMGVPYRFVSAARVFLTSSSLSSVTPETRSAWTSPASGVLKGSGGVWRGMCLIVEVLDLNNARPTPFPQIVEGNSGVLEQT